MKRYINDKFPHLIHGADYNPEQWREIDGIWEEDMRLMQLAGCNEMTVGIFSWAKLEPREGEYEFSCVDEIIDRIGKNGGKVIFYAVGLAHLIGDGGDFRTGILYLGGHISQDGVGLVADLLGTLLCLPFC